MTTIYKQTIGVIMNKQTLKLKVVNIKRVKNSLYGNPNYNLTLEANNGHTIKVGTLNDSMVNYYLGGHVVGNTYEFTLKVNRKSNKLLKIANAS